MKSRFTFSLLFMITLSFILLVACTKSNSKIEEVKKQDINKSGTNQTENFEKMEEIFREIEQPIKQIVSRIKDNDSKELLFSFSFAYEENYPKDEIVFMNGEVVEIGDSSKMEIFQSILGLEDAARELSEKKIIQHVTVKVQEGKNYDIRFYIDPALTPFITDNEGSPNSIVYLEEKDGIFDHEKFDYHIVESNWYLRITPPRDE